MYRIEGPEVTVLVDLPVEPHCPERILPLLRRLFLCLVIIIVIFIGIVSDVKT